MKTGFVGQCRRGSCFGGHRRQWPAGGGKRQVHVGVDLVLVLAADRDLQVVPRRRQVQRAADANQRTRHVEREIAPDARLLDLRLLAKPLGVEQRGEAERGQENDDPAAGCGREESHLEAEVDERRDPFGAERVDQHQAHGDRHRLRG